MELKIEHLQVETEQHGDLAWGRLTDREWVFLAWRAAGHSCVAIAAALGFHEQFIRETISKTARLLEVPMRELPGRARRDVERFSEVGRRLGVLAEDGTITCPPKRTHNGSVPSATA